MAGEGPRGTVVLHHGTPGAAALFTASVAAGAERGLRHVCYSRPGYGLSSRRTGRSVADCAPDVAAIADTLGLDRFYTVGWSGGGPHAMACAALLPERVIAAATIGGVAPAHAPGLDWTAGMGQENLTEFAAARAGSQPLMSYLQREAAQLASAGAEQIHLALGDLVSEVDRAALSGEYAQHLSDSMGRGLAPGVAGWLDDDLAFMSEWGVDLSAMRVPVSVWQGAEDRFVPFSHGEWLAGNVASAQGRLRPEHGHLSLVVGAYGEILDDLLEVGQG